MRLPRAAPLALLVALLLVPGLPVRGAGRGGDSPECVLLTWDAAPATLVQRWIDEGKLPNLARLAASGVRARWSQTSFPSKTACGHASLFTGCYTAANGIAANNVPIGPDATHDCLALATAFNPKQLTAEPFWHAAARQGKRTLVFQAPFAPRGPDPDPAIADRLVVVEGYASPKSDYEILDGHRGRPDARAWTSLPRHEGGVQAVSLTVGDTTLFVASLDTVFDGRPCPDTLLVSTDRDGRGPGTVVLTLAPTPRFSPPLLVRYGGETAGVHLMLLSIGPGAGDFRLVKTSTAIERVNGRPVEPTYLRETGGFVGNGPIGLYERGGLGKPFFEGGDGSAEARYLAGARLVVEGFGRKIGYWIARTRPQVVVGYLPFPDEALHAWMGFTAPGADAPAGWAPAAWRNLETVLAMCDAHLGTLLDTIGSRGIVTVASDHGMAPVTKVFRPNVVLREAGLLAVGGDGRPDLARTRVLYGYEDGAFLRVNRARYRNGVVPPAEERQTIERAVAVLSAARDDDTGMAVVTGFYYPEVDGARYGIGGPRGGDVYLDVAPGVTFDPSPAGRSLERTRHPRGVHVFNPRREDMHAIFYARGPGIPAGRVIAPIRITRIVPSLCRLLGLEPPRQAKEDPLAW